MFNVTFDSLEQFANKVGFWGGAKYNWDNLTQQQKEYLEQCIEDYTFESITDVNDFMCYEVEEILEEMEEE